LGIAAAAPMKKQFIQILVPSVFNFGESTDFGAKNRGYSGQV
jgi:hypothetical protein